MSLRASLVTYLNTKSGLTALAGSRIRWHQAEQSDALPYIIMHQIDENHAHHMLAASGKAIARIQFDCVGASPLSATNVGEQVRLALDGYRGAMGSAFVSMCHLDTMRDEVITPLDGSHRGRYAVQLDFQIGWTVSVPTF